MTETTTAAQSEEIVARLKLSGAWFDAASELADEKLLLKVAGDEGISVSDEELQAEFDEYRRERELHKAEDTNRWLEESGVTIEQVESHLEAEILGAKLADKLIDDAQIDAYYNQNPNEFEYAQISQLAVADAGAADEIALSIREEGEDFAKLAKQHSLDAPTKLGGGFVGFINREEAGGLPGDAADRIFSASAGDVIGPIALPGDVYCLIQVEEVGRSELDDDLRAELRQQLFNEKMSEIAGG